MSLVASHDLSVLKKHVACFFALFTAPGNTRKYVFGRNVYARAVVERFAVDGVIDDYAAEISFYGVPIVRSDALCADDLVLVAAGGRPLTARASVARTSAIQLDYFSFQKYAAPQLPEPVFNEGFSEHFHANQERFEAIHARLEDALSKDLFRRLVNFRLTQDLWFLEGLRDAQAQQYFESFLDLREVGETFLDVGAFDGYTSLEFARRFPGYERILAFEPEPSNAQSCRSALSAHTNTVVLPFGLSDIADSLHMTAAGSGSVISEEGDTVIRVEKLDELLPLDVKPTFIKFDIEGGELQALRGARMTIGKHRPKLAISVYHRTSDFWQIPEEVLSVFPHYRIYMRHYTESIYETVMFFVPRNDRANEA
jgi:FkbM family methyltransferase